MTKKQEAKLDYLRKFLWEMDTHDSKPVDDPDSKYEYKTWEVNTSAIEEGFDWIWLTTEIGLKNDEGTMASVLCRTHRHIGIGKNGGIFGYGKKPKGKDTKMTAFWDVIRYCRS